MSKDTHGIPIRLELPRYEVMTIMYALRELGNKHYEQAIDSRKSNARMSDAFRKDADAIFAIANKIFATTRKQFVAHLKQTQNEHKTNT